MIAKPFFISGCVQLLPQVTVPCLVKIAEESPVLSVRGVALWSLNLIGQSSFGAQRLEELGWECFLESGIIPARNWQLAEKKISLPTPPQYCSHEDNLPPLSPDLPRPVAMSLSADHSPRMGVSMTRRPRSVGVLGSRSSVGTCNSCEICHPKIVVTKNRTERITSSERSREHSFNETIEEWEIPVTPLLLPFDPIPVFVASCEETPATELLSSTGGQIDSTTASDENLLVSSRPTRSRSFGASGSTQDENSVERKESVRRLSFVASEEETDVPRPLPRPKKIGQQYSVSSGIGSLTEDTGSIRRPCSGNTLAPTSATATNGHSRSQSFGGYTKSSAPAAGGKAIMKKRQAGSEFGTMSAKERTASFVESGVGSLESKFAFSPVQTPSSTFMRMPPDPYGVMLFEVSHESREV